MEHPEPDISFFSFKCDITREDALKLLSRFLSGTWASLTPDQIDIQLTVGGVVNRVYIIENTSGHHREGEDTKVILRRYGGRLPPRMKEDGKKGMSGIDAFRCVGHEGEVLAFHSFAQIGIGPQLLGITDDGRIEQFIPNSRSLNIRDMKDPLIVDSFARNLAKMHSMKLPFDKNPKDFIGILSDKMKHQKQWKDHLNQIQISQPEDVKFKQNVMDFDYEEYVLWMKETMKKIRSRPVTGHNDLKLTNTLVRMDTDNVYDKTVIIDYEFVGTCYRGNDIGYHFQMWTLDMEGMIRTNGNAAQHPYPTRDERRFFIRKYMDEIKRLNAYSLDEALDSEDHLLLECEFYGVMYHFFFMSMINPDPPKLKTKLEGPPGPHGPPGSHGPPGHRIPFKMLNISVQDYKDRRREVDDLMAHH